MFLQKCKHNFPDNAKSSPLTQNIADPFIAWRSSQQKVLSDPDNARQCETKARQCHISSTLVWGGITLVCTHIIIQCFKSFYMLLIDVKSIFEWAPIHMVNPNIWQTHISHTTSKYKFNIKILLQRKKVFFFCMLKNDHLLRLKYQNKIPSVSRMMLSFSVRRSLSCNDKK